MKAPTPEDLADYFEEGATTQIHLWAIESGNDVSVFALRLGSTLGFRMEQDYEEGTLSLERLIAFTICPGHSTASAYRAGAELGREMIGDFTNPLPEEGATEH